MKRTLSAILVVVLCLALCACGASAPAPTPEPTPNPSELLYNKYSAIIDALEAEDYDGAVEAVNAMRPAPKYQEIVITTSNYSEYFEVEPNLPDFRKDSFGNPEFFTIFGYVKLKDQYFEKLVTEKESDVKFNVYYLGKAINVSADFSNSTYTIISTGVRIEQTTEVNLRKQAINGKEMFAGDFGKIGGSMFIGSEEIIYNCNQITEYEIKGVTGTLFLYE